MLPLVPPQVVGLLLEVETMTGVVSTNTVVQDTGLGQLATVSVKQ